MMIRIQCQFLLVCVLLTLASGCRAVYPGRDANGPIPCVPASVPRELAKVTIPDYIIEPPDVLSIEAVGLFPKSSYQMQVLDVVSIVVNGIGDEFPLQGTYAVQPSGLIELGPFYGSIYVIGKTVDAFRDELLAMLRSHYHNPMLSVSLSQIAAQQQIVGEHLVAPDGRVNLGTYGRVRVVGLTIEEAKSKIEAHLCQFLQSPKIALDVVGFNSKVFYVVTQGAGLGDRVAILPIKGNETVLDAIGQIQGLESNSSTRMWVARPGANESGGDQILPVDWLAITQRGDVTSNYQLLPGDRVFVSEDKLVAVDSTIGKIVAPIERLLGVVLLGTTTSQNVAYFKETAVNSSSASR